MDDATPQAELFVTRATGGDVVGIGFRKLADTDELRSLADRLAASFYGNADLVRTAADELDKLRIRTARMRKTLNRLRAGLAEDDPQSELEVGS